jgi:hypothetical protein
MRRSLASALPPQKWLASGVPMKAGVAMAIASPAAEGCCGDPIGVEHGVVSMRLHGGPAAR